MENANQERHEELKQLSIEYGTIIKNNEKDENGRFSEEVYDSLFAISGKITDIAGEEGFKAIHEAMNAMGRASTGVEPDFKPALEKLVEAYGRDKAMLAAVFLQGFQEAKKEE